MKNTKKLLNIGLLLICIPVISFSQEVLTLRSNNEGLLIGLNGGVKHWASSYFAQIDEADPNGVGFNATIGYGFNQQFTVLANLSYHNFIMNENWDNYDMTTFDLGLRYNLGGTLQKLRPYGEVNYAYHVMEISPVYYGQIPYDLGLKGGSPQLGLGLNYFFTPKFSLNLFGKAAFGKFKYFYMDGLDMGESPKFSAIHFGLGLNYVFNKDY